MTKKEIQEKVNKFVGNRLTKVEELRLKKCEKDVLMADIKTLNKELMAIDDLLEGELNKLREAKDDEA